MAFFSCMNYALNNNSFMLISLLHLSTSQIDNLYLFICGTASCRGNHYNSCEHSHDRSFTYDSVNVLFFSNSSRLFCQICSKSSHTTLKWWQRLDQEFQFAAPPRANFTTIPTSSTSTLVNSHWFHDIDANHHINSDLNHLNL